jgi:hypothetical protein
MNQLEDPETIEALCTASGAGVSIDLIVRGFCCLRPGVPGRTERIRIRSIVGRFLEHSRIFPLHQRPRQSRGRRLLHRSADWMSRNLSKRIEVASPVRAEGPRRKLWEILDICLRDRRQAWELGSDGVYTQLKPDGDPEGPETLGTHLALMNLTRARGERVAAPHIVSTARNCAWPLIIRAYASDALASGYFSIMWRAIHEYNRFGKAASRRAKVGTMSNRYAPLGDYGVIGDLHTVALVSMDGSIDFLCLPSFDSPSVFVALLDAERAAAVFQIAPILDHATRRQLYLPDTNVLLTALPHADGVAELSDFMPVEDVGQAHNLVRRAKTVRGELKYQMRCDPRFDYARSPHTAELQSDTEVIFVGRAQARELVLRLRSSVPMRLDRGAAVAEFTLGADQKAWFVLEVVLPQEASPSAQTDYETEAFKQTVNFWRRWISRSTYNGRWRETVNRSASR